MGFIPPVSLFLLIGYITGRFFKKSAMNTTSLVIGLLAFFFMQFVAGVGQLDTGKSVESISDSFISLVFGLLSFAAVQAGGRIGVYFKQKT